MTSSMSNGHESYLVLGSILGLGSGDTTSASVFDNDVPVVTSASSGIIGSVVGTDGFAVVFTTVAGFDVAVEPNF